MPKNVTCPTCRKSTPYENNPHRPFCSKRCRMMDLGAWADESYRVPVEEDSVSTATELPKVLSEEGEGERIKKY